MAIRVRGAGPGGVRISGDGGPAIRMFSAPQVPVVFQPPDFNGSAFAAVVDGSGGPKLVTYGGILGFEDNFPPPGFITEGYAYDVDSTAWSPSPFSGPAEDSGYGRFLAFGSSIPAESNKLLVVGGVSTPDFSTIVFHSGSVVYNAGTDVWGSTAAIPNYTTVFNPTIAVDPVDGKTFVISKDLSFAPGPVVSWLDQLSLCEDVTSASPTWVALETSTALDLTTQPTDGFGVFACNPPRNNGGNTELLFITASNNSVPQGTTSAIYKWTQTQASPVSGTWSYVTGANWGVNSPDYKAAVPYVYNPGEFTSFWDESNSRWTFLSFRLEYGAGVWWTWDGASTWNSGTLDFGSWYSGPYLGFKAGTLYTDAVNGYIYTHRRLERPVDDLVKIDDSVWRMDVPADLNAVTWQKLSD